MNLTQNNEEKYLYKHLPFNQYSLQLLIDEKFWLSAPELLNDPFEGDYIIENIDTFQNERFIRTLLTKNSTGYLDKIFLEQNIKKIVEGGSSSQLSIYSYLDKDIKRSLGTTSFSKRCDSLKMWSHYADSHKGFIIIFDREKLEKEIYNKSYGKAELCDVKYTGNPILQLNPDLDYPTLRNKNLLLTSKLEMWIEEEEVRIIIRDVDSDYDRKLSFSQECIVGLIFGCMMNDQHVLTLTNIIFKYNFSSSHKIAFIAAEKNQLRNELTFREFAYKLGDRVEFI